MRRSGTVASLMACALACGGVDRREMNEALGTLIATEQAPPYIKGVAWKEIREIYADRSGEALWVSPDKPLGHARALVEAVADAESEGLRVADYELDELQTALEKAYHEGKSTPGALAELDVRLTAVYLEYGHDLLAGRLDPRQVDKGWYISMRHASVDSVLRASARDKDFSKVLSDLAPSQPDYPALAAELVRYRSVAARGGWPRVAGPLKAGASGPAVTTLRARLAASGDLDSAAAGNPAFDGALEHAVARFRRRHGLPEVGGLDPAAVAALNVPVEQRIRQLELNLERLRWLPNEFGARYVYVNIPDFYLHAFDGGKEVLSMRVIVGEDYDAETPVFADTMSYVEFRPSWNVPGGIALEELVPKIQSNPRFLEANNYEVVPASGKEAPVDPRSIDWDDVDSTNFPYRIRQGPGATNALGLVKFMFPNRFDIYMHDTPADHLFHRHRRAFSHGCIRLEHPDRFARYVLDGLPGWTPERIAEAMNGEDNRQVRLQKTLPVYILYLTAFVRDGVVQYRDDLYGTDRQAMARLGTPAPVKAIAALRERLEELMKG